MNLLDKKIKELRKIKKKALVAFITAGFPDFAATGQIIDTLEKNGADIIEIGVPFSDPIADGPTIQASSEYSLKKGVSLRKIFNFVKKLRKKTAVPILLMSYLNPIYKIGLEKAAKMAKGSGVDGFIIPDMIPEESTQIRKAFAAKGISLVFLAAPNTPKGRMQLIDKKSRGFVYVISLTGVTGKRNVIPPNIKEFLLSTKKNIKQHLRFVGFGISSKEQVIKLKEYSDGIIVGSAIIDLIRRNPNKTVMNNKLSIFIKGLRKALDN